MFDKLKIYDPYLHGTHAAGIAVRGNPGGQGQLPAIRKKQPG